MTDITVTEGEVAAPDSDLLPAAADSVLTSLRERRTKIEKSLHIDLQVPRWDDDGGPAIFVRYAPAKVGRITGSIERRRAQQKDLGEDWVTFAHADVLTQACLGVYAVLDDQKLSLRPGDPYGEWTTFDKDLAESLGMEAKGQVDVAMKLYLTPGDLEMAYAALLEWSGVANERATEADRGN